jgi:hypothetical protein
VRGSGHTAPAQARLIGKARVPQRCAAYQQKTPKCLQSKGFKAQTSKECAWRAAVHKAAEMQEVNWSSAKKSN